MNTVSKGEGAIFTIGFGNEGYSGDIYITKVYKSVLYVLGGSVEEYYYYSKSVYPQDQPEQLIILKDEEGEAFLNGWVSNQLELDVEERVKTGEKYEYLLKEWSFDCPGSEKDLLSNILFKFDQDVTLIIE